MAGFFMRGTKEILEIEMEHRQLGQRLLRFCEPLMYNMILIACLGDFVDKFQADLFQNGRKAGIYMYLDRP